MHPPVVVVLTTVEPSVYRVHLVGVLVPTVIPKRPPAVDTLAAKSAA
jgi:hypothetical protein